MAFRPAAKKLAPEELFEYGIRALGRRPYTKRELKEKLARRAASPEWAVEVLARIEGLGYLDDARTAESHAYHRREFQRLGRRRVLSELQRRGVAAEVAERTVDEAYKQVDELDLVRDHLRRKLGCDPDCKMADPKAFGRVVRGLQRAGFGSATIMKALGKIAAEPEWLEGIEDALADSPGAAIEQAEGDDVVAS